MKIHSLFLMKMQPYSLELYQEERDSESFIFCEFSEIFQNTFFKHSTYRVFLSELLQVLLLILIILLFLFEYLYKANNIKNVDTMDHYLCVCLFLFFL